MARIKQYVDDINANLGQLPTHGPVSKYELPDENLRGRSASATYSRVS